MSEQSFVFLDRNPTFYFNNCENIVGYKYIYYWDEVEINKYFCKAI